MKVRDFQRIPDFLKFSQIQRVQTLAEDFAIYSFEEMNDEAQVSINAYRHHYYEVTLDIKAGCSFQVDHFDFPLGEKRLTIIAPQRMQSNSVHPNFPEASRGYTMFFSEDFFHQHLNESSLLRAFHFLKRDHSPEVVLGDQRLAELTALFESIRYEVQQYGLGSKQTVRSYVDIILQKARQDYPSEASVSSPGSTNVLVSNFEYLLHSRNQPFTTVKEFAEQLHVTPKYLSEVVKAHTGKTALELILNMKMTNARALLSHTQLSVKEVAHELGFEEANYFSTFFKQREGMSPLQFRNI